jgi:CBS domain-containing protein
MKRVVAEGRDPRSICVAEVMTDDPLTISMNKNLENCITLMRRHSFRHLPVCHEGHLVGRVSLRDILLHDLNEKDDEARMMSAYIHSLPSVRPFLPRKPIFFHWHEGNLAPGVSSTVTLLAITSVH